MDINKLTEQIQEVSNNFETQPYIENLRLLKEGVNLNNLNTPLNYEKIIDDISEVLRQTRLLFLLSVFNKVCKVESKVYSFSSPYQAGMKYYGVTKIKDTFYLIDEDGHYRDIFSSEKFVDFIDEEYWEIYE